MTPIRPTSTTPKGRSFRACGLDREGGVAVTVAVMTAVLVGVLAIAIDLGRAWNLSTELDNAADAYAIAGATQLDGSDDACTRAIEAAVAAGNTSDLANTETFASSPSGSEVYLDPTPDWWLDDGNIRFLTDLAKDADGNLINYVTDSDPVVCGQTAEYIEVTIDDYRIDYSFAGILGAATEASPKGYAVAGTDILYCGVAPLMICELEDNFWENMVNDPTYYRGVGVWAKAGKPNETWGPGNAGFLDLGSGGVGPPAGPGLCNALGAVNPNEDDCFSLEGLETAPGNNTGARLCFNTRFDIYHGSLNSYRTDPNYQPAANTVKGRFKAGCDDPGWQDPGTQYNGPGTIPMPPPQDAGMMLPLDECAYPSGGGGCIPAGSQGRMGDGDWDLETYLEVNHAGMGYAAAMSEIMPTGPTGPNLGRLDKVTRYDVYRWELGFADMSVYGVGNTGMGGLIDEPNHRLVNNVPVPETPLPIPLGTGPTPPNPQTGPPNGPGEFGGPQCYTGPMGNVGNTIVKKDRRVVRVAVVDCTSGKNPPIKGKTSGITAEGFMYAFMLAPWKDDGTNHEIYMEIIGPAESQDIPRNEDKAIVQLYE